MEPCLNLKVMSLLSACVAPVGIVARVATAMRATEARRTGILLIVLCVKTARIVSAPNVTVQSVTVQSVSRACSLRHRVEVHQAALVAFASSASSVAATIRPRHTS